MPDRVHSVNKDPGDDAYNHLYHNSVVGNSKQLGVSIALSKASQFTLLTWAPYSPRIIEKWASGVINTKMTAASGKRFYFSQTFGPVLRRVVRDFIIGNER